MNLIGVIARCPPFADLPLRAVADLSRVVQVRRVPLGDAAFEPGDPAETFYLVHAGALALYDRDQQLLGRVAPEQFIGEAAVLLPSTHTIRAIAVEDTTIVALARADVDALWHTLPPVAALVEMALASWVMADLENANQALLAVCDFALGEVAHLGLREMLNKGTFSG